MRTRPEAVVVMVVVTALSVLLVAGHTRWSGDELLRLTATHGINRGDLAVAALWAAGVASAWRLGRRRNGNDGGRGTRPR
jgi:hypothetical protein